MAFVLHGLVDAQTPPLPEPAGQWLIPIGEVAAVVSAHEPFLSQDDVTEQALIAAALKHNDILMTYATIGAVVPVRYGAIFSTKALLRTHINAGAEGYSKQLRQLKDMREYAIVLTVSEPAPQPAGMSAPESGRAFLQARLLARTSRENLSRDRHRFAAALMERMAPWVAAQHYAAQPRAGRVLDASVLVSSKDHDSFMAGATDVSEAAGQMGLTLTVTGPLPPYSFTGPLAHRVVDNVL